MHGSDELQASVRRGWAFSRLLRGMGRKQRLTEERQKGERGQRAQEGGTWSNVVRTGLAQKGRRQRGMDEMVLDGQRLRAGGEGLDGWMLMRRRLSAEKATCKDRISGPIFGMRRVRGRKQFV